VLTADTAAGTTRTRNAETRRADMSLALLLEAETVEVTNRKFRATKQDAI